mmetsp:Transcript_120570/g.209330  ORF Transcript_120570/g.209330 Transcript_120570/m.209330 type:complete len:80 (+) Transcript_120570:777-1016(+)
MCVLLQEFANFVEICVDDDWRELSNPCKTHPKIVSFKAKTRHPFKKFRESALMIYLCDCADMSDSSLLARLQTSSSIEL